MIPAKAVVVLPRLNYPEQVEMRKLWWVLAMVMRARKYSAMVVVAKESVLAPVAFAAMALSRPAVSLFRRKKRAVVMAAAVVAAPAPGGWWPGAAATLQECLFRFLHLPVAGALSRKYR